MQNKNDIPDEFELRSPVTPKMMLARNCYSRGSPIPNKEVLSKAVSLYKAVKTAWRDWGIALITWNEYGGFPR